MKNLKMWLFVCMLALSKVVAGSQDVTQEKLANLIQVQDDRLRAFQVKYRLTQGEYSEDGELMPDVVIDCGFGHDITKGHRYLHEKWVNHSSGDDLEREYSYDGKRGMSLTLKQPGDPGRTYGRIIRGPPDYKAICKPEWAGYGFIREYGYETLSSAIKNAKSAKITSELLDGEPVYRVEFVLKGEKERLVDPSGKTRWFTKDGTFIAWLSPEKGYRPVRIDRLVRGGSAVSGSCAASDFRQVNPGIWFPYRLERSGSNRNDGRLIVADTIAINEEAAVPSRLEFPPYTHVTNEIWQIKYQVGGGLLRVRLKGFPKAIIPYLVVGALFIAGTSVFVYCKCRRKRQKALA